MIAARLRPFYEAQAKERYEATVGRPKKDADKSVEKIPQIKSRDEAGKAAGVRGFDEGRALHGPTHRTGTSRR
jgi:hypothetical protein